MEDLLIRYIEVSSFKGRKFSNIEEAIKNTSYRDISCQYKGEGFNKVSKLMEEMYGVECSVSLEDMKLIIPMTSKMVKDYTDSNYFIEEITKHKLNENDFEI